MGSFEVATVTPLTSRLAEGYQSIPPLGPPLTDEELEALVAEERAQHYIRQMRRGNAKRKIRASDRRSRDIW